MATVSTVTAIWNGFQGAPGYSRFRFFELADVTQCNAAGAAVRAYFEAVKTFLVNASTVQVQSTVQHHDLAIGELTGETAMSTVPASTIGTASASANYAGGAGYVINWVTGGIWNGRKVRGRTFMVPGVNCYFTDGTITSAAQTLIQNAGLALVADPTTTLGVWAKKFNDEKPKKQVAGALFGVTGVIVPDRSAQLRTRRT
jgi:hypothetical protein